MGPTSSQPAEGGLLSCHSARAPTRSLFTPHHVVYKQQVPSPSPTWPPWPEGISSTMSNSSGKNILPLDFFLFSFYSADQMISTYPTSSAESSLRCCTPAPDSSLHGPLPAANSLHGLPPAADSGSPLGFPPTAPACYWAHPVRFHVSYCTFQRQNFYLVPFHGFFLSIFSLSKDSFSLLSYMFFFLCMSPNFTENWTFQVCDTSEKQHICLPRVRCPTSRNWFA